MSVSLKNCENNNNRVNKTFIKEQKKKQTKKLH